MLKKTAKHLQEELVKFGQAAYASHGAQGDAGAPPAGSA